MADPQSHGQEGLNHASLLLEPTRLVAMWTVLLLIATIALQSLICNSEIQKILKTGKKISSHIWWQILPELT